MKTAATHFQIRPIEVSDREWILALLERHWGSPAIVTRGRIHQGDRLKGFVAAQGRTPVALATYRIAETECELVSLNSELPRHGIGAALLEAVRNAAVAAHCKRLWLVTTNDNVAALRFYQIRGFALVAVHRNALDESRTLKPEIPALGMDDIPLRDEIELEIVL